MTLRHRLILLLTSACAAFILLCPVSGSSPGVNFGPIVSTAPPLFAAASDTDGGDSAVLNALRREAGMALDQLTGRGAQ